MCADFLHVLLFTAFTVHIFMTASLRSNYNDCANSFPQCFRSSRYERLTFCIRPQVHATFTYSLLQLRAFIVFDSACQCWQYSVIRKTRVSWLAAFFFYKYWGFSPLGLVQERTWLHHRRIAQLGELRSM